MQLLLLLLCEYRHGHGRDTGRRRAAAPDLPWWLRDDRDDDIVWHPHVGSCASRRGIRQRQQRLIPTVRKSDSSVPPPHPASPPPGAERRFVAAPRSAPLRPWGRRGRVRWG